MSECKSEEFLSVKYIQLIFQTCGTIGSFLMMFTTENILLSAVLFIVMVIGLYGSIEELISISFIYSLCLGFWTISVTFLCHVDKWIIAILVEVITFGFVFVYLIGSQRDITHDKILGYMFPILSRISRPKNFVICVMQFILILLQLLGIIASIAMIIDLITKSQIFYSFEYETQLDSETSLTLFYISLLVILFVGLYGSINENFIMSFMFSVLLTFWIMSINAFTKHSLLVCNGLLLLIIGFGFAYIVMIKRNIDFMANKSQFTQINFNNAKIQLFNTSLQNESQINSQLSGLIIDKSYE